MIIKEKQEFLVMKINSEMSDFYEEHKKILDLEHTLRIMLIKKKGRNVKCGCGLYFLLF